MDLDAVDPEPLALPTDSGAWGPWLEERGHRALADAAGAVAAVKDAEPGDPVVLVLWNDIHVALDGVVLLAGGLAEVHPDPAVTELGERLEREARTMGNDLLLDAGVYAALARVDPSGLEPATRRVLELALRDFRRAGVDRDEPTRAQLQSLNERLDACVQAFARGIREGSRSTRVPASALDGLPQDFRDAHPADADGLVTITTAYPDTLPFLTHSGDGDARRAVAHAAGNVAWPENDAVVAEMLELREQKAHLLGYPDWPTYDAEVKMIGSGKAVAEFLDRLTEAAADGTRSDLAVLEEAARAEGEERIDTSTWRRYSEAVLRESYGVDAQEVRRYFRVDRVVQGVLDVTARLFGLTWTPVDAPAWHEDVSSYDVSLTENGQRLGRVHLDLHPRDRKFNHAAVYGLVPGLRDRQLAEAMLVCNFPRGLLEHADVVTLFHEFGHLVHAVLAGRHDWVRFSGVAAEWDFVEAPSMMFERWAWDPAVLQTFAVDEDGAPIPPALLEQLRAADEFAKGFWVSRQVGFSALSYQLHQDRPADLTTAVREILGRHSPVALLPDEHPHTAFGHLEGYTSAYYTYLWSLVIAKDLFSAFAPDDLFAPEVAHRYRDLVLAAGGSGDAADLVEAFLGRPYDDRAFRAWLQAPVVGEQA